VRRKVTVPRRARLIQRGAAEDITRTFGLPCLYGPIGGSVSVCVTVAVVAGCWPINKLNNAEPSEKSLEPLWSFRHRQLKVPQNMRNVRNSFTEVPLT
jgi:hypothetical protein